MKKIFLFQWFLLQSSICTKNTQISLLNFREKIMLNCLEFSSLFFNSLSFYELYKWYSYISTTGETTGEQPLFLSLSNKLFIFTLLARGGNNISNMSSYIFFTKKDLYFNTSFIEIFLKKSTIDIFSLLGTIYYMTFNWDKSNLIEKNNKILEPLKTTHLNPKLDESEKKILDQIIDKITVEQKELEKMKNYIYVYLVLSSFYSILIKNFILTFFFYKKTQNVSKNIRYREKENNIEISSNVYF